MFGKSVEVKMLEERIESWERSEGNLRNELERLRMKQDLEIEKAKNELRKEMQKDLVESDLRRVKAEAMLETYERMNTKDDANKIREMLEVAIKGLAQKSEVKVVK